MEIFFLLCLFLWALCGLGAGVVAAHRGSNGCLWFAMGFFLGPIGLALSFVSGGGAICPACRKNIDSQATKCPYCQTVFGGNPPPPPKQQSAWR